MSSTISFLAFAAEGGFNPLSWTPNSAFMWTVIIFVLSLPAMWGMVFGPITDALQARDKKADDAITEAQEVKVAAEKAQSETEAALRDAREESKRQIREAKEMAEKQRAELVAQAQAEAEQERARVRAEIEAEKTKAMGELRDLVVDLSIGATSKLLNREVQGEDQKEIVRGFLADVDGTGARN